MTYQSDVLTPNDGSPSWVRWDFGGGANLWHRVAAWEHNAVVSSCGVRSIPQGQCAGPRPHSAIRCPRCEDLG